VTSALVTLAFALVGLGFAALGVPLALGRIPPNGTYGFRTAKTLSNAEVWFAVNRVQGIDLCIAGVVIAVLTTALYFGWASAPSSTLALVDAGVMVTVLVLVAAHGFITLGRIRPPASDPSRESVN
jgi:uncharacterized membrane protein